MGASGQLPTLTFRGKKCKVREGCRLQHKAHYFVCHEGPGSIQRHSEMHRRALEDRLTTSLSLLMSSFICLFNLVLYWEVIHLLARGWRGGSAVKGAGRSPKELKFNPQNTHRSLQLSITPVSGDPTHSWGLFGRPKIHTWCTERLASKTSIHTK